MGRWSFALSCFNFRGVVELAANCGDYLLYHATVIASRFVICECSDPGKEARKKPMEGKSSSMIGDPACSPHLPIKDASLIASTIWRFSLHLGAKGETSFYVNTAAHPLYHTK